MIFQNTGKPAHHLGQAIRNGCLAFWRFRSLAGPVSLAIALFTLPATLTGAEDDLDAADFELPTSDWSRTFNLRGAVGYKDNILLSSFRREASPFWQSALDFSALRLSLEDGVNFTTFASFEDRRYFSSDILEKEQLGVFQARLEKPFGDVWQAGAVANYFYLDQIFDASSIEEVFTSVLVKGHRLGGFPFVTRKLPHNFAIELRLNFDRQFYEYPLDDYWEGGPQLHLSKKYGHRSEASLSYSYLHRLHDKRTDLTLASAPIPGHSLRYNAHEVEGILNHSWDAQRHWRSRARLAYKHNEDQAEGYFDYSRYRFSKRFGYYAASWQATVEGKILVYDYEHQPSLGSTRTRELTEYSLALRFEKSLSKSLRLYAESEHERVTSTSSIEEYSVNTFMAGVDWEF